MKTVKTIREFYYSAPALGSLFQYPDFPVGFFVEGISAVEWYDLETGLFGCLAYDAPAGNVENLAADAKRIFETFQDPASLSLWLRLPSGETVATGFIPLEEFLPQPARAAITKIKYAWHD
jgi:hypothetical protein